MITDIAPELLTETQWQIAHAIARDLVTTETDVNELGKAIAYLRSAIHHHPSSAGTQFSKFLKTLVSSGNQIGHSGKTPSYYRNIDKACNAHLRSEESNAQGMLQILGWATRLLRYYKVTPIGEISAFETKAEESAAVVARRAEIEKLKTKQMFAVSQIIEATVSKKHTTGSQVTYLIEGVSFKEKEAKTFKDIPEGGTVKVQIKSLKEDGSINHIKFVES